MRWGDNMDSLAMGGCREMGHNWGSVESRRFSLQMKIYYGIFFVPMKVLSREGKILGCLRT